MYSNCLSPLALAQGYLSPENLDAACRLILNDFVSSQSMSLWIYLGLFFLTCAMEAPVYWLGLRKPLGRSRTLWAIIILNLATHPAVTWFFTWIFSRSSFVMRDYLLFSETFAFVVEGLLLFRFYKLSFSRAFLTSFCANSFSWWGGLYISTWVGL